MAGVAPEHLDYRYTMGMENPRQHAYQNSPRASPKSSGTPSGAVRVVEAKRLPHYPEAVAVGELREVDTGDEGVPPQTITKKFVRQIEVPFVREVKVPVKKQQIVPAVVRKHVPVRRLREVPVEKEVDEEYTEVQTVRKVRNKEVWVKQVVPEEYDDEVEVVKTRRVRVPATELREVDEVESIDVHEDTVQEVDGFRVDQVEDTKVVEVEEYRTYELHPQPTDHVEIGAKRDIGIAKHPSHRTRVLGHVYAPHDQDIAHLPHDDKPDHKQRVAYHTPIPARTPLRGYSTERPPLGASRSPAASPLGGPPARVPLGGGGYTASPARYQTTRSPPEQSSYRGYDTASGQGSQMSRQDAAELAAEVNALSFGPGPVSPAPVRRPFSNPPGVASSGRHSGGHNQATSSDFPF